MPVYTIDPVLPKQKAPPSGGSTSQSGTKRGASALAKTLKAEEAEQAAIREIWRQIEENDKAWEAYANEFSEADFNQDFEDQIGIALTAEDSPVPAAIPTQHSQVKSKCKEHFTPADVEPSTPCCCIFLGVLYNQGYRELGSPPKRCRESPAPASPAPALHSVPVELLPPRKRFTASERIKTLKREVVTLTARLVAVEIQIDAFQRDDIGRDVKETRLEARVKRLEDAMQRR
ncbi:hypothetical protein Tco_0491813 [Tanacetum coccineum]